MSLTGLNVPAQTTAVFLYTSSAGSGATVYTVPSGKVFKGFLLTGDSSAANFDFTVDGSTVTIKQNSTYTHRNIPVTLPSGTVLGNSGTQYFTITGELVDGN
jgi:hypothetical protein